MPDRGPAPICAHRDLTSRDDSSSTDAGDGHAGLIEPVDIEYWRAMVVDIDDAVVRYTPHLVCVWCNEAYARLLGTTQSQLIGRNIEALVGPERAKLARDRIVQLLDKGNVPVAEIHWELPDGSRRWMSWNARIVRSPVSGEIEMQSVGRDIHALKEREFKLEQAMCLLKRQAADLAKVMRQLEAAKSEAERANLAKSRFLASMSHELRTPLNAIIGFSDVMRLGVLGTIEPAPYQTYAEDIWKSSQHLLALISELLDLSRVEGGLRKLQMAAVAPRQLTQDVLSLIAPAETKGLIITAEGLDSCGSFVADPLALRQAMLNLLYNAIKFTPAGGRIWIVFRRVAPKTKAGSGPGSEGGIEIEIQDNGPGLTRSQIKSLLSPIGIINDDQLVSRPGRGAGLGVPIARSLAEAHGGSLRFDSAARPRGKTPPASGTHAVLFLPQPPALV